MRGNDLWSTGRGRLTSRRDGERERRRGRWGAGGATPSRGSSRRPGARRAQTLAVTGQKRNDPPTCIGGSFARREFPLRSSGGGGGNRTRVPVHFSRGFYARSRSFGCRARRTPGDRMPPAPAQLNGSPLGRRAAPSEYPAAFRPHALAGKNMRTWPLLRGHSVLRFGTC